MEREDYEDAESDNEDDDVDSEEEQEDDQNNDKDDKTKNKTQDSEGEKKSHVRAETRSRTSKSARKTKRNTSPKGENQIQRPEKILQKPQWANDYGFSGIANVWIGHNTLSDSRRVESQHIPINVQINRRD